MACSSCHIIIFILYHLKVILEPLNGQYSETRANWCPKFEFNHNQIVA